MSGCPNLQCPQGTATPSARPAPLGAQSDELAQSLPLFFDQERGMVDQLDEQRRADFRPEIRLRSDSPNILF